jgi:shikimate kinase
MPRTSRAAARRVNALTTATYWQVARRVSSSGKQRLNSRIPDTQSAEGFHEVIKHRLVCMPLGESEPHLGIIAAPVTSVATCHWSAYHRYEYRALEEVLARHSGVVIASPCGFVPETRTLNLLLSHCFTVWLRATPEDHIKRVIGQAAPSLMQDKSEAMSDLRTILASRSAHHARADISYDTSGKTLVECFIGMCDLILTSIGDGVQQSRDWVVGHSGP